MIVGRMKAALALVMVTCGVAIAAPATLAAAGPQDASLLLSSPHSFQVFQRGADGRGDILIAGRAAGLGNDLEVRWGDEPWVVDGAAVRVSLVCFSRNERAAEVRLDGRPAERVNADLTAQDSDLTTARHIDENQHKAFIGTQKNGNFDIPGELARKWLAMPLNPNGRPNSDVLRPWANGSDITRQASGRWIIDFGVSMTEESAALYEAPFAYSIRSILNERQGKREERASEKWWILQRSRPEMRTALDPFERYIVTPRVAKHRIFVWLDKSVLPDTRLVVIARDDDTTFGILHSRFHEIWSLRTCSWHGVGNDPTYNAESVFNTFPFPEGLTPNIPAANYADNPRAQAIAAAAKRLDELRRNWLNPPDLVKIIPEVVPGFPDRILPVSAKAEAELKKRTLTNLYNQRPAWLDNAHRDLDQAVAAAYGWPQDISDDESLARLLALNHARAQSADA